VAIAADADGLSLREHAIVRGIARHARAAGWHLVLDPYALHAPPGRWDGLLVPTHRGHAQLLARCRVPAVCVAWSQLARGRTHAVEDRYAGARLAAHHLVERGYRTFAYLGFGRTTQSRIERHEFHRALGLLGRRVHTARTFLSYAIMRRSWDKVMDSLDQWLGRLKPPVGLFVACPGFARAMAELALARGLRIPRDLGILAADDDPVICGLPPALTALRFDYAEVGLRAAERLEAMMNGARVPVRPAVAPPELVPRRSTDREGTDDPLVADALWFIDSRRTESISPRSVAAGLGTSQRTLERRLREAGRGTIQQEIAKARVEHAKLHLADSGGPLSFVARLCGFGSVSALTRAFRRHVGMSPRAWLQAHPPAPKEPEPFSIHFEGEKSQPPSRQGRRAGSS
jgi:LacI family transcriptional regulator